MKAEEASPIEEASLNEKPNLVVVGGGKVTPIPANSGWKDRLLKAGKRPEKVITNALIPLREAPQLKGLLSFDGEKLATVFNRAPPWDRDSDWKPRYWKDNDDIHFVEWLQRHQIMISHKLAGNAAESVAQDHTFYPIKEYLLGLEWDGKPRIDTWLEDFLGVESSEYISAIGPRWLISAVARIMEPGCKADCMLILEGPQGSQKSTAIMALASKKWFTDEIRNLNSKDTLISLAGPWIIEFGDLEGFKGNSVETLKAFLSRSVDYFRPLYGRRASDNPRRCVFAGSTNKESYLEDSSGNRRFWPVKCGKIDVAGLEKTRDQIWAEAYAHFQAGFPHWLETPELQRLALQAQDERYVVDPWEEIVQVEITEECKEISTSEVLEDILKLDSRRCGRIEEARLAKVFQHMGWVKIRFRSGPNKDKRGYRRG